MSEVPSVTYNFRIQATSEPGSSGFTGDDDEREEEGEEEEEETEKDNG